MSYRKNNISFNIIKTNIKLPIPKIVARHETLFTVIWMAECIILVTTYNQARKILAVSVFPIRKIYMVIA